MSAESKTGVPAALGQISPRDDVAIPEVVDRAADAAVSVLQGDAAAGRSNRRTEKRSWPRAGGLSPERAEFGKKEFAEMMRRNGSRAGFSLVELVVVIVIIGILAAIAIPRMSRGSTGAAQSALALDLARLREAITMYSAEHNGKFPGPTAAEFADQLTLFSSVAGATQKTRDTTHRYGPYLAAIPPCPIGENAGTPTAKDVLIDSSNSPPQPNPGSGEGWVYNPTTGEILPNTEQTDDAGNAFTTY